MPRCLRFAVLALVLAGAAQGHAQGKWNDVRPPEGTFAVSMPCVPATWETSVTPSDISGPYTSHLGVCRAGDETYLAGWVDYLPEFRPNTEAELKANQDNFIKGFGAVLLTSSPLTYQGFPGLEFTSNRAGMFLATGRVVMDGTRPLMWLVVTPLGQDRSANIRQFLTSFRVTPRP